MQTSKTAIVIPARLGSTRYPRKMLLEVEPGVTLIEKVYLQACQIYHPQHVYVATDSFKIKNLFGDMGVMTSPFCENGTERIADAANFLKDYDYFVNVQGDLITVPGAAVNNVIKMLEETPNDLVTVCKPMKDEDRADPNTVKAIHSWDNIHWFCRAPLSYGAWHLGIYGYSRELLEKYSKLNSFPEEEKEKLEQLRWLQNGYKMSIIWTNKDAAEINTPEDFEAWQQTRPS